MDRRPTPDPGASETAEPGYAAARRNLEQNAIPQNAIPENEGPSRETTRSPADAPNIEGTESDKAREAAAQRGRAAN